MVPLPRLLKADQPDCSLKERMTELNKATEASTVRKVWGEALVSGGYQQGNIFLRQVNTHGEEFCCLGVLCDLAQKAGVIPEPSIVLPSTDSPSLTATTYQYGTETNQNYHIPDAVKEWAGINDEPGNFFLADLEELNDTGKSFKDIAKMIAQERRAFE